MKQFRELVYDYYEHHGRHDLLWRIPEVDGHIDPYKVLVSELMLQQTQVVRVTPKYTEFLTAFPDVALLAAAPLGDVLKVWSGLGYNRRAQYLHRAAQTITIDMGGIFPTTIEALVKLPGVGINTAGALLTYAYDAPVVFIETNVRTVFIHHFFNDQTDGVTDKAIYELAAQALDTQHPRHWYWALMDYGSHLKRTVGNTARASKSYKKQSTFHGSRRQVRGAVIRLLTTAPRDMHELGSYIEDGRLTSILAELEKEGLIRNKDGYYSL